MSRARKKSDDLYNARRRWRRAAERYLKKADASVGATKSRYEAQARHAVQNALLSYSVSKPRGVLGKLASRLGVDINESKAVIRNMNGKYDPVSYDMDSRSVLVGNQLTSGSKAARDEMARNILSIGNIGSRFYGGLVEVWGGSEEGRAHPNRAIMRYFGVDSIMDVMEMLEDEGIDLYAPDVNDDVYKSIQLNLQMFILTRR